MLHIKETIINYFTRSQRPGISPDLSKWTQSKSHRRSYSTLLHASTQCSLRPSSLKRTSKSFHGEKVNALSLGIPWMQDVDLIYRYIHWRWTTSNLSCS